MRPAPGKSVYVRSMTRTATLKSTAATSILISTVIRSFSMWKPSGLRRRDPEGCGLGQYIGVNRPAVPFSGVSVTVLETMPRTGPVPPGPCATAAGMAPGHGSAPRFAAPDYRYKLARYSPAATHRCVQMPRERINL